MAASSSAHRWGPLTKHRTRTGNAEGSERPGHQQNGLGIWVFDKKTHFKATCAQMDPPRIEEILSRDGKLHWKTDPTLLNERGTSQKISWPKMKASTIIHLSVTISVHIREQFLHGSISFVKIEKEQDVLFSFFFFFQVPSCTNIRCILHRVIK